MDRTSSTAVPLTALTPVTTLYAPGRSTSTSLFNAAAGLMLLHRDNLSQSLSSLNAHKLRTVLTVIGLTMGVATLITVMTIVQGANLYVEQKIANLGTNVFQVARTPFAATDFEVILRALKNKHIELDDLRALREICTMCRAV